MDDRVTQGTQLTRYDAMCRAIDAAYEVDEVKDIHDKALALEHYERLAKNVEAEDRCYQIRRAANKAGHLLNAMEKAKPNPGGANQYTKGQVVRSGGFYLLAAPDLHALVDNIDEALGALRATCYAWREAFRRVMSYWNVFSGPGPDGKRVAFAVSDPFPTIDVAEAEAWNLGAPGPGQITPFMRGKQLLAIVYATSAALSFVKAVSMPRGQAKPSARMHMPSPAARRFARLCIRRRSTGAHLASLGEKKRESRKDCDSGNDRYTKIAAKTLGRSERSMQLAAKCSRANNFIGTPA